MHDLYQYNIMALACLYRTFFWSINLCFQLFNNVQNGVQNALFIQIKDEGTQGF